MPGPLAEKMLAWQNWAIGKAGFRTTISWWPYVGCDLQFVLHSDIPRLPSEITQVL